jgi:plastocyanin
MTEPRARALRHAAVTAFVAAVVLAACGSSGSSNGSSGGGPYGGQTTNAAAPAAGGGTTAAPAATGGAAPAAGADAVSIKGFAFNPGDLSAKVGDTVTWTNDDGAKHRIKSEDGSFDSDDLSQGDTFEHQFTAAGTFAYICGIHPSMKGSITVTA